MASPSLSLLAGGIIVGHSAEGVRVQLIATSESAHDADALILEEDTHLILSAPAILPRKPEHPIRTMTALIDAKPVRPGEVIVKGRSAPFRFLAVVHDIERTPSWRPDWVRAALNAVVQEAAARELRSIALPVLAGKHGNMEPAVFAAMLRETLLSRPTASLASVYLLLPPLDPVGRRRVERALNGLTHDQAKITNEPSTP